MLLNADPTYIATRVLAKLAVYYERADLEELVMNDPGSVWIKPRRAPWEHVQAPEIDYEYISRVCKVLANINSAKFSEEDLPVVSCEIPGRPFRFQAIVGPNVRYSQGDLKGVALAIRALTADTKISFSSYRFEDGAALPGATAGLLDFAMEENHIQALRRIVSRHESIIISGATSTGKSTFTNRVIDVIPRDHRMITVEDARELTVPHPNRVHLMVPRNRASNSVDYRTIIDSLVRLTPDWIICGELSIANAQPVYSTMGKGHPVITTVHAGNPDEAIAAFMNNMSSAGAVSGLSGEALRDSIRAQVGAIIQLERRDGERRVVDMVFPSREIIREREAARQGRAGDKAER